MDDPLQPIDTSPKLETTESDPASASVPERSPGEDSLQPSEPPLPAVQPEPPWSFADLGAFLLFAAVTLFLSTMVAAGLHSALAGDGPPGEMQTPLVVLIQVLWEVCWFGFIYLTITTKYRRPFWQALRWRRMESGTRAYFLAGIGLAAAAQVIFGLFPSQKDLPIEKLFSSPESAYLLALFGILVAPFIEELVFRGFFYPAFERRWGLLRAVVLTALLFALIHAPQLGGGVAEVLAIFLVGVVLSYTRGKTGSLVPSYVMHLAYNSSLFVSLYLSTDGFRNLAG